MLPILTLSESSKRTNSFSLFKKFPAASVNTKLGIPQNSKLKGSIASKPKASVGMVGIAGIEKLGIAGIEKAGIAGIEKAGIAGIVTEGNAGIKVGPGKSSSSTQTSQIALSGLYNPTGRPNPEFIGAVKS